MSFRLSWAKRTRTWLYIYIYIYIYILGCHTWEPFTAKFIIYTCSQFQERFAEKQSACGMLGALNRAFNHLYMLKIPGTAFLPEKKRRLRHARRPRQGFLNQQSSAIRPYSPLFAAIRRYSSLFAAIFCYLPLYPLQHSPLCAANSTQNRLP